MSVHPRETLLRGAIIVAAGDAPFAVGTSLAPHWLLPAFVATTFVVLGSIAAGLVAFFYALWCLGWLTEMSYQSPDLLIGDSTYAVPQPYWPWSRRVKTMRKRRRIAALERSVGLREDGTFS